ncbi:MAG: hypothetical protein V1645_01510 [archaeon]
MNNKGSIYASLLAVVFVSLMLIGVFLYMVIPGLNKVAKALDHTNIDSAISQIERR